MKVNFYPGCTLKTKASNLERTAKASMAILGIELEEMAEWTCCGANFSLANDNLMKMAAPIRNLARAEKVSSELVTICSACYNVLKRANYAVKNNAEKLEKLNLFLEDSKILDNDDQYHGKVNVLHLLELIKEKVGFDNLKKYIKKPLNGLKVAPYYGCQLIRPQKELEIEDQEAPVILHNLIDGLGGDAVDYSTDTECCGSYVEVIKPREVWLASYRILRQARAAGAKIMITSCPLCLYNLDKHQFDIEKEHSDFKSIPILYFTQLLGLALGLSEEELELNGTKVDPRPVLKESGLL